MTQNLDRVALVTGGSRGIGAAIALRLARAGSSVVVNYAGNAVAADGVVQQITAMGGRAAARRADVADDQQIAALFDDIDRTFGGVDVVVHNAGVMPRGALVDLSLDDIDTALRVNVRGTLIVDQQAARRLRAGGALINISSSVTRIQSPGNLAYTATKGAVEAFTLALARELRGRDITVNAVAPGAIATEMLTDFIDGHSEHYAALQALSPLGRVGQPQDIAEIVAFLAGPGRWLNGQTLFANGGAA